MKKFLLVTLTLASFSVSAQRIKEIYVNLYTDSLKKGTFNYINIDGKLDNGKYLPLDSTHLIFWASNGFFHGNSLWIERDFVPKKVDIKVTLRNNPAVFREFSIYVKQMPDPALKTMDDILKKTKTTKG